MESLLGAVGDLTVDILLRGLTSMPVWGQETEISGITVRLGGNVGNMAVGAGCLHTDFLVVADIGDDSEGKFVFEEIKKRKMSTEYIRKVQGGETSKTYACIRADGERFMMTSKGILNNIERTVMQESFPDCKIIFLGGWCSPPRVDLDRIILRMDRWHREKRILATDLIWSDETWERKQELTEFLKKIDIIFLNEKELLAFTECITQEAAIKKIRNMLVLDEKSGTMVIVKLGAKGAMMITGRECWRTDAYPCKPIDTVGAGDLFDIGFLHARYQLHFSEKKALKFATVFAALCISGYGQNTPTQEAVLQAMKER